MSRALGLLLLLAACGKQPKPVVDPHPNTNNETVCPESRDLVCVGGTECEMSKERGCRVCRCADFSNGLYTPPH